MIDQPGSGAGELHPDLDPNPCEAHDSHGGTCGTHVDYATPLYAGRKVICDRHLPIMCGCGLTIDDPKCCTNVPEFGDWLAQQADRHYDEAMADLAIAATDYSHDDYCEAMARTD